MLQTICMVTLMVPNVSAVATAYEQWLDYRIVNRDVVSVELARLWQAPHVAGRAQCWLQPASGEPVYVRFVEAPLVAGYAPLRTLGWNAVELLVEDPDALAARLADSPFKLIGAPRNLSFSEHVRAMQVIGPAHELLYFTRITPGKTNFKLGHAQSFVDRPFIIINGGADLEALRAFYIEHFKLNVSPTSAGRIAVLSRAYGLDDDTPQKLALASLPENFAIELDQYPAEVIERPQLTGELPPGIAMVSFTLGSLNEVALPWRQAPQAISEWPYDGHRAAVTVGAAGEWIELIEEKAA
ncbi:MAG: hypothetical protein HOP19_04515 [Acidobacteria bacterium]|nr:hypothetical protein [Acidobacteriota bacterium]